MRANSKLLTTFFLTVFFVIGGLQFQANALCQVKKRNNVTVDLEPVDVNLNIVLTVQEPVVKKIDLASDPVSNVKAIPSPRPTSTPKPAYFSMMVDRTKYLNIQDGLCLKGEKAQFASALSFLLLNSDGKDLFIDYGADVAEENDVDLSPSSYVVSVNGTGISIIAYDRAGTIKGIKALKEMLGSSVVKGSFFPYLKIAGN